MTTGSPLTEGLGPNATLVERLRGMDSPRRTQALRDLGAEAPGAQKMEDTKPLTRDEWLRRFADRIKEVARWDEADAMSNALAAADAHESNERAAGNTIDWMDPEEEADCEMSYWDDDEATDS